jgi:P27 family predicted phage terminase small subunit
VVPRVDGRPERLVPPRELSAEALVIWRDLVGAVSADHFTRSDAPLLASYCEASALADRAARELAASGPVIDGKASPWLTVQEKQVRAQVALSQRLRLSPQARFDRLKAGSTAKGGRPSAAELYARNR